MFQNHFNARMLNFPIIPSAQQGGGDCGLGNFNMTHTKQKN
jgi:hypothetical protein